MVLKKKILFADQLRALAIISVVISHYFGVFWFDPNIANYLSVSPEIIKEAPPSWVSFINYFPLPDFTWGPFGVDIFFLISGFVIPISLEKYTRKEFFIKRFFRIYPVYFIGFMTGVFFVYILTKYYGTVFTYSPKEIFLHSIVGLRDAMQGKNIDMVIWTLEVEIKFYLICLIFISMFKEKSLYIFLIPSMIFISAIFIAIVYKWNTYYPLPPLIYMFAGTVFYYHMKEKISNLKAVVLIGILFIMYGTLLYTLSVEVIGEEFVKIIVCDGAYALLFFSISYIYREKFVQSKIISFISNISYPFYVIHTLVGYACLFFLINISVPVLLSVIITLIVVTAIAYLIHIYIEKPSILYSRNGT